MGIKRCPSFSKRPGFPCGLRVLLVDGDIAALSHAESLLKDCSYTVTPCSSTAEALARLNSGSSFDVLLADKGLLTGKTRSADRQQLLDSCSGVPCILMAQDPTQEDIMAGIQLGAVDFLAKPLSPLKLQNIWQHTVRKMMGNMNINCSSDSTAAGSVAVQPAGNAATAPATAARKELDAMEVIPEEPECEQAAAGEAADAAAPAADTSSREQQQLKRPPVNTAANVALATMSSLYEPARCPSLSLSRCGSSAATEVPFSLTAAGSPDSPCKGPSGVACKLQKSRHAPVHSCPSTRSLNSMASSYSTVQLAVPGSPGSPSNSDTAAEPAATAATDAAGTSSIASAQQLQQPRCIKKAVRHPTPVTPASKPPLASKPQAAAAAAAQAAAATQPAAGTAAPNGTAKAGTPSTGLSSVPLPTGLGPLPQGMVWGMPMCPLARAPGIVPASSASSSSSSQQGVPAAAGAAAGMMMPPMSAWGMCGMSMGLPPVGMPGMGTPFMPGFMMPPMPPMAMPFGGFGGAAATAAAPGMMGSYSMPGSGSAFEAAAMHQQQDAAAAAAAPVSCLPHLQMPQQGGFTGASAAAALNASLGGAPLGGAAADAAAAMDIGDAFDFMLGDITAEDDLDVGMIHSGLLDGELTALEKEGLKLPADLAELQEQQQQQQRYQQQQQAQQRASFECGSNRLSFDCHGRQRVSFDCSTASTTTGARVSFECSAASRAGMASQRVSFEVNCNSAARAAAIAPAAAAPQMAAPAVPAFCAQKKQVAAPAAASGKAPAAIADPLLGSMSDLFAACSGDSCSEGSGGMTHVDSCGMLADLQSLFAAEGCAGVNDDGCSGVAAAAAAAGLFDDVMDDLPLELSMKKSNSLAELLNASLTAMQA